MRNEIKGIGIDLIGLPSRRKYWPGQTTGWATRPLCTRYLVVSFGLQAIALSDGNEVRNHALCWALGTLDNGEAEILGWWQDGPTESIGWSAITTDLIARGVKRIRMLADSSGPPGSPSKAVESGFGGGASRTHSISAAQQRRVAVASARMRRVQASLSRAVLRHGAFADAESAAAFVDSELQRLDRGFWSQPEVAARRSSRARVPLQAQAVAA